MNQLASERLAPGTHTLSGQSMLESDKEGAAATLSPPHTWTESGEEEVVDDRLLFSATVALPSGKITSCRVSSEYLDQNDFQVGAPLFKVFQGNGQSFFLSASITSTRQRIFLRISSGRMTQACELLCEFEHQQKLARVSALALRSAFGPTTPFVPVAFTTKHSSNCALTHLDYASVAYLGHLPTDVIGRSILSFVYAPDVHIIRQAHIDLHNNKGRVVKSVGPIRFVAHNGALLTAETEWSAYVNPWSKKMEMVVARHKILDAPVGDADVLATPTPGVPSHVLPTALAKTFEEELRSIMSRPVPSSKDRAHAAAVAAQSAMASAMCTQAVVHQPDLGAYIDRLVETLVVNGGQHHSMVPNQIKFASTSSSVPVKEDVTLSYSQINCLENVHRLLKSQSQADGDDHEGPVVEDLREVAPALPLTREVLLEHTRRWEEEYKHTWKRRLTGKRGGSTDFSSDSPSAKMPRPSSSSPVQPAQHQRQYWTPQQRAEYYRTFAPIQHLPTGSNYQITSVPLPVTPVDRHSAFSSVPPRSREVSTPLALSIHDQVSVIQTTPSDGLVVPVHPCASRLICMAQRRSISSPSTPKVSSECVFLPETV